MPLLKKSLSRLGSDFKPDRDWRLLFGGFLIFAIIIFAGSVSLYRVLDTLEAISRQRMTAASPTRLDQSGLDQVTAALGEKKNRFETLLVTPPPIVDPSR